MEGPSSLNAKNLINRGIDVKRSNIKRTLGVDGVGVFTAEGRWFLPAGAAENAGAKNRGFFRRTIGSKKEKYKNLI